MCLVAALIVVGWESSVTSVVLIMVFGLDLDFIFHQHWLFYVLICVVTNHLSFIRVVVVVLLLLLLLLCIPPNFASTGMMRTYMLEVPCCGSQIS